MGSLLFHHVLHLLKERAAVHSIHRQGRNQRSMLPQQVPQALSAPHSAYTDVRAYGSTRRDQTPVRRWPQRVHISLKEPYPDRLPARLRYLVLIVQRRNVCIRQHGTQKHQLGAVRTSKDQGIFRLGGHQVRLPSIIVDHLGTRSLRNPDSSIIRKSRFICSAVS